MNGVELSFLYRGPLESCNYACAYCPFAKKKDTRADLARDRAALERFVAWVGARTSDRVSVLFTPWGEGLVRSWYRDALVALTQMPHVDKAAIQTNLSARLDFARDAVASKLGIWATFHPDWTTRDRFVAQVERLVDLGARVSCGVVAMRENVREIELLREALPRAVYLWVNAAKSEARRAQDVYYTPELVARLSAVDPLFEVNAADHPSAGASCRAGASVVSIDGDGDVRRCHFVREVIGNLYDGSFDAALRERPCPNATCGCHIGYVHLDRLELRATFEGGVLERIPAGWPAAPRAVASRSATRRALPIARVAGQSSRPDVR